MDLTNGIKRAPRWAWYTVGGVGAGALAIHFWKNRTTADGTTPAAGPGTDLTTMGGSPAYGAGGSPAGVIVPPVILPPSDSGGVDPTGMFDSVVGGVNTLLGSVGGIYQDVWGPVQTTNQDIAESNAAAIQAIAQAGSAPQPVASNPTPVVVAVAQPAPAPIPTAQTAAPAPAAPAAPPPDRCTGEYPNDAGNGDCYKVVCASGKGDHAKGRWHFHKNGQEMHVANTC